MSSLLGNWLDMDTYSMRMSQWYWLGREGDRTAERDSVKRESFVRSKAESCEYEGNFSYSKNAITGQKQHIRKEFGSRREGESVACCIVDAAKMRELQAQDDMLSEAREVAMKPNTNGEYYLKEGLMYRSGLQEEEERRQKSNT